MQVLGKVVGETGFEPATLWSQTRCATRLRHSPTSGRLELREPGHKAPGELLRQALVGPAGLEPAT